MSHEQTNSNAQEQVADNGAPFAVMKRKSHNESNEAAYIPLGVIITPELRTSGLLFALSSDDLKNLLCLLTYVTSYSTLRPTVQQLAHAMRVSENRVRTRMQRLTGFLWLGEPLVREIHYPNGSDVYAISSKALSTISEQPPQPSGTQPSTIETVPQEVVVAVSRAKYSRPRDEVERKTAEFMGWDKRIERNEDEKTAQARRDLKGYRISDLAIDALFAKFGVEECIRQLEWLPYRKAKNPGKFIVAAIEGRYDEPMQLRYRKKHTVADSSNESRGPS